MTSPTLYVCSSQNTPPLPTPRCPMETTLHSPFMTSPPHPYDLFCELVSFMRPSHMISHDVPSLLLFSLACPCHPPLQCNLPSFPPHSRFPNVIFPFALNLHLPPTTCLQYCASAPEEFVASLLSARSKVPARGNSKVVCVCVCVFVCVCVCGCVNVCVVHLHVITHGLLLSLFCVLHVLASVRKPILKV